MKTDTLKKVIVDETDKTEIAQRNKPQKSMVWTRAGNQLVIKPLKMSDIDTICKSLPPAQNPAKYVTVLQSHTKYAHMTGADYRAILLRTLDSEVTEEILIQECPSLDRKNDEILGQGTATDRHTIHWEDPKNQDAFFKELRKYLEKHAGSRQDLSFAVNTKQKPKETASEFFTRFKAAWTDDARLPINKDMYALFANTMINNMNPRHAQLIRITTTNLLDLDVVSLGKRIRELDASGGFSVKTEQAMFSGQVRQPEKQPDKTPERRLRSDIVCYRCGKRGHMQRDCRHRGERNFNARASPRGQPWQRPQPVQPNKPDNKYQTEWHNKTQ